MNKKATESILVCVNHPDFSKELIAYGKRLSLEMNLPLQGFGSKARASAKPRWPWAESGAGVRPLSENP